MVMVRTVKSRPKTNQSEHDLDWRIACHIIKRSNSVDLGTSSNEIKVSLNTNLLPKFTFVKTSFLCVF